MKKKKMCVAGGKRWRSPDHDPTGSYTGVVTDDDGSVLPEEPVQDVDDL